MSEVVLLMNDILIMKSLISIVKDEELKKKLDDRIAFIEARIKAIS